ncbi:uncharacterized protein Dsimw501_GD27322 [Drosophila simulans]|nr:uncharacterized protein Dsimw501_GD27322 [Drosophila simulans]
MSFEETAEKNRVANSSLSNDSTKSCNNGCHIVIPNHAGVTTVLEPVLQYANVRTRNGEGRTDRDQDQGHDEDQDQVQ